MKTLIAGILFFTSFMTHAFVIQGEVQSIAECLTDKTMVWLAPNTTQFKKKILLMHTMVPEKGSFEFYVKPGEYLVAGSNEKGCFFEQVVNIEEQDQQIKIVLQEQKK